MKTEFNVPTRAEVSENNQKIFDQLEKGVGFVPNLYATFAYNDTALGDYLTFQNRKSTLSAREREIINLVTSQVNGCEYCLAAHTALGKMNGFDDDQIIEIRNAEVTFNEKYAALASFVKEAVIARGKPEAHFTEQLLDAGYTKANLVDILVVIGDKIVSNFLHGITQIPVDFPKAKEIETAVS